MTAAGDNSAPNGEPEASSQPPFYIFSFFKCQNRKVQSTHIPTTPNYHCHNFSPLASNVSRVHCYSLLSWRPLVLTPCVVLAPQHALTTERGGGNPGPVPSRSLKEALELLLFTCWELSQGGRIGGKENECYFKPGIFRVVPRVATDDQNLSDTGHGS